MTVVPGEMDIARVYIPEPSYTSRQSRGSAVALSQPGTWASYRMSNTDFRSLGLANNGEQRFRNINYLFF